MVKIILLAGATASGKSALALRLASQYNGIIINADASQVYEDLPILTAQPNHQQLQTCQHHLYGILPFDKRYCVHDWVQNVVSIIESLPSKQSVIITGGTGLYFHALLEGLSPLPPADLDYRDSLKNWSTAQLYESLQNSDSESAIRVGPHNRHRLIRALEIARHAPASYWYNQPVTLPLAKFSDDLCKIVLLPPRALVYEHINHRVHLMIEQGAIAEVEKLIAKRAISQAKDLPSLRSIGYLDLSLYLQSETSLSEAISAIQQATRRYAKRQYSWARHRMSDWLVIEEKTIDAQWQIIKKSGVITV